MHLMTMPYLRTILAAVATSATLPASASTFSVGGTGNTFTISRTGEGTNTAETVRYRTVPLSAFPGQHYTEKSGAITLLPGVTSTNITVTTCAPSIDVYKYQTATSRSYRFEVTDGCGVFLGGRDASVNSGLTQFNGAKVSNSVDNLVTLSGGNFSSGMSGKYLDVSYTPPSGQVEKSGDLAGYVLIDDSYDYAQKPATVSTTNLVNSTGATASYLDSLGYKICATVCFTEKEKDDGYQYLQIIAGDSTAAYDTGYDPEGSVNDPVNSIYKVCFELSTNSNAEGKAYLPHRSTSGTSEFSHSTGKLHQQKYRSGYEGSGAVVLPVTTSNITTRFDAGGKDNDTWGYKDLFVRMALCETNAPAKLAHPVLAPGPYGYGNEFYVSVPFGEIVTVSGTPKISSDWGELSYISGSGSNVLTFKGTINAAIGTQLIVRTLTGTVKDLAGNTMSTPLDIYKSFSSCTVEYPWPGAGTAVDPYVITTTNQLGFLASCVNATYGDIDFAGKFFELGADISYDYQYEWDNIVTNTFYTIQTEDNYTAIGGYARPFKGTFDGRGHTISGVRITKPGSDNYSTSQGLFGYVGDSGTVKNIFLRDAMIYGHDNIGGIAGYNCGTIMDCTVYHVRVFAGQDAESDFNGKGPIAGYNAGTVARSHYRDCATLKYDGYYYNSYYSDLVTLSTVSDVTATPATVETATIDGTLYYATGNTFSLSCSIPVPENWSVVYTATGGATVNDATLTLASDDTIVSAAVVPPDDYVEHWQAGSNHDGTSAKPYLITTPEGLQLLSDEVNGGTTFYGTYFQLGNDIDMGAVANFTPIGNSSTNYFFGRFNGRGRVISHLTINQEGSNYVGLFGYNVGVVENLGLCDASITGGSFVGGIAGEDHGIIDNCCVARSSITAISNYVGAVAGSFNNGQGDTYHSTLVYDPRSAHAGGDAFNIGEGTGDIDGRAVLDPAVLQLPTNAPAFRAALIAAYADPDAHTAHNSRGPDLSGIVVQSGDTRLYAVSVPADLSVSDTDVVLGFRSYFAPDSDVTLDAPEGYVIASASYTDASGTHDIEPVNDTYSFAMPASDVDVTATVVMKVYYDPQGNEITDSAVVGWLSENGFTQADINALGHDAAATDKLYECYLVNCNLEVPGAGGALGLTGIAVTNGAISITAKLDRKAPLGGIKGVFYLYGANDLAAGFERSPIPVDAISFGEGDPLFKTDPTNESVSQSVTATFDVDYVPYKFFKAAIDFPTSEETGEPEEMEE